MITSGAQTKMGEGDIRFGHDDDDDSEIGRMIYNSSNTAKKRYKEEAAATLLSISSSRSTKAKQQEGDSKSKVDSTLPATGTSNNSDLLTQEEREWLEEWPRIENPTQEDFTKWSKLARKEQRQRGGKTAGEMLRDMEDAKLRRCYVDDIQRVDGGPYHYSKRINEILNKPDDSHLTETEKLIRKKAMIFGSVVLLPSPTKYENECKSQEIYADLKEERKNSEMKDEEIKRLQEQLKRIKDVTEETTK